MKKVRHDSNLPAHEVLILIVMEDTHEGAKGPIRLSITKCLNPYCNGRYS